MLKPVLDVAIPVLVVLMMVVTGLGLTVEDFRRVGRRPRFLAWATCNQAVLLPGAALALTQLLNLKPYIGEGMLLVAACPAGSLASFYAFLAGVNVALAVSLIAVSCLAALAAMPLWLAVFEAWPGEETAYPVPTAVIVRQLLVLLVLPILARMALRRPWRAVVVRHQRRLLGLAIRALALLVAFVLVQEWEHIWTDLAEIAWATVALTTLAALAGYGTGWAGGAGAVDRVSVGCGLRGAERGGGHGARGHRPGSPRIRRLRHRLLPCPDAAAAGGGFPVPPRCYGSPRASHNGAAQR
jgi:BASS family bile acid:Na+ symporter